MEAKLTGRVIEIVDDMSVRRNMSGLLGLYIAFLPAQCADCGQHSRTKRSSTRQQYGAVDVL